MAVGSSWERLREHREKASRFPLDILIWGPSDDKTVEFRTRKILRNTLLKLGHNAQFSEELCKQKGALIDPLNDEQLQAESAHVIVMLYGSRGTQTERDVILAEKEIASKSIILIEKTMFEKIIPRSISGKSWEDTGHAAKIIAFKKADLPDRAVKKVCKLIEQIRCACYVRALRRRNLNGN